MGPSEYHHSHSGPSHNDSDVTNVSPPRERMSTNHPSKEETSPKIGKRTLTPTPKKYRETTMSRNTLEYQAHHQEDDTPDETLGHDTKVDILSRYTEKMAESHPHILQDLILLNNHKGRDQTDWDQKFQEPDLPAQYTHAFRTAVNDMADHEKAYAAHETAHAIGYPLESKLEDLNTEITFHKASNYTKDILDPRSHRALLHHTAVVTQQLLEEQRAELAEGLKHLHNHDVKQTMLAMAYTRDTIDKVKEGFTFPFQHRLSGEFQQITQERAELLDQRFQEHLADQYPELTGQSPREPEFQEAFRNFGKDYLGGDVHALAFRYADRTVGISNPRDFTKEQHQDHTAIYHNLSELPAP